MEELEELWAPYKAKRQTRAQMAKAKGLEPLDARLHCWNLDAHQLMSWSLTMLSELVEAPAAQAASAPVVVDLDADAADDAAAAPLQSLAAAGELPPTEAAAQFLGKDVPDVAAALAAARDILAPGLSDRAGSKASTRGLAW
eukprot:Skav221694  [mRNA]  locus=scaffold1494:348566:351577:+ [translate_table: standard]